MTKEESKDEDDYYDEEEVDDEEEYEDEREPITHCIHRLPFKGQKVNLLSYQGLV